MISNEQAFCIVVKEFFRDAKKEHAENKLYDCLTANQQSWVLKKPDILAAYGISKSFGKCYMQEDYRIKLDDVLKVTRWMLDHVEPADRKPMLRALQSILFAGMDAD